MKLRYSTTSPFVRKVHVLAIETGQIDKIELVKTNTADPNSDHGKDNPLEQGAGAGAGRRVEAVRFARHLRVSRRAIGRKVLPAGRFRALDRAAPAGAGRRHDRTPPSCA